MQQPEPVSILLDSGAFSAWKRNEELSARTYGIFLKQYGKQCDAYVSLDVMPGEGGPEAAAKASWSNFCTLNRMGLQPMPVFHRGEDLHWLRKYRGVPYIGLGAIAGSPTVTIRRWLDKVFSWIDWEVKVHGFGVGDPKILERFPFYSADSLTWRRMAGFGHIFVPGAAGKYVVVNITGGEGKGNASRPGYDHLGPMQKQVVKDWLDTLGFDVSEAQQDLKVRDAINLAFLQGLTSAKLYHVTNKNEGKRMIAMGARNLLASYYWVRDCPEWLKEVRDEAASEAVVG